MLSASQLSAAVTLVTLWTFAVPFLVTQRPAGDADSAASRIMVSPYGSAAGVDADDDGVLDLEEDRLADKYAPIIIHDKADANLPVNVDWLLQRSSLEYYNNNGPFRRDDHVGEGG